MLPGYSPTDRPKTAGEIETGAPHELHGEVRRSSGKGAWITLAVVVLVILGVVIMLSFMPESTTTTTTITIPVDAPPG